ncbi:polysaccharide pyruvyl transferase family protein [Butyrivibrio sp. AE3009]|uniref:polysaccharide pyruvyl transferase family protein n=1 Tax=Butyrivibrio sp. AE3009 TaxID=1280666 RepID=UPI0003B39932|nr:polysaccharide pyruvyl transferase family protein [Butyrivibrio sp. AE3009]
MENINLNRPIIMYMHAGSGNHGCEAIADSTLRLIYRLRKESEFPGACTAYPVILVTNSEAQDRKYYLKDLEDMGLCVIVEEKHIDRNFINHVLYYGWRKITGDRESFQRYRFAPAFKEYKAYKQEGVKPLAISIGGDNYCYPEMVQDLILADNVFRKRGFETILWGCSIEPDSLKDKALLQDLMGFEKIFARESITYDALLSAGLSADKLVLRKDPAFELETQAPEKYPEGFIPGKMVGINLSPMVQERESQPGITMECYKNLIRYVLDNTDNNIALVPHVVWAGSDDRKPLGELYKAFADTGRVVMLEDAPAEELKGYIAACNFFVGARTHSTIAAYSSGVKTLVIGYSVKSRGIAKDLFGTIDGYVLPVQELSNPQALVEAYVNYKK